MTPGSQFRFDEDTLEAFPFLRGVVGRWERWLRSKAPNNECLGRKCLIEMWPYFRAAIQQDAGFDDREIGPLTTDFELLTGIKVLSTRQYRSLVGPLIEYLGSHPMLDDEAAATAFFQFVISGRIEGDN